MRHQPGWEFIGVHCRRVGELAALAEGDEMIAQRHQLAGAVEPGFEEVKAGRAVEVVLDIVLPGPDKLDRAADLFRNPGRFDHKVIAQPPAEAAAHPRHIHGNVALGDAERRCHELGAGSRKLGRRPEHDFAVLKVRRAVLRLEADMGEERIRIGGLDDVRRAVQR
jgi:hypothetical protein